MKRRLFVRSVFAAAALNVTGPGGYLVRAANAAAKPFPRTPSQTEGPYYPRPFPADADWNLLKAGDGTAVPAGVPLELSGVVVDKQGAAQPGLTVEIWQADSQGLYDHPRAPDTGKFDRAFQGYGRTTTDDDGIYRFLTLAPTPYTGRPPHIHVKIRRDGEELLTTQLYIRDHPDNGRDGIFAGLFFGDRDKLMMDFSDARLAGGLDGKRTTFRFVI